MRAEIKAERAKNEKMQQDLTRLRPVKMRKQEGFLIDSQLVRTHDERFFLLQCLPGDQDLETLLLYRASRDGWLHSDFHSRCDDQGATLVVFKTTG
jgi:hypothetical protein